MKRKRSVVDSRMNPRLSIGLCAVLGVLVCATVGVAAPNTSVAMIDDRANADRLLVVDCALPGQVRQLGTGITYMAPRRAIKTTGSDCAIRGGEYVAYDRANYATALKVWLPSAQGGDKVAQTHVGEIYEKGLGTAPDYASAALWYRKASDQGYARASINLGFLYEQGLGVARDEATALKLYRKAAGLEGSINLDAAPAAPAASREELDSLRKELERTRQELEKARRALDEERLKSSQEIERLLQKKMQAAAAGNTEETRRLEALLKEREAELEKRRTQVAQTEQANENFKARLARLEGESASLRQELEAARRQLAQSQRDIEDKRIAAAETQRKLDLMQLEIARQKSAAAPADPARIKALEALVEQSRSEAARQKQEIARLESDVSGYKDKVATLELKPDAQKHQPPKQLVAMTPPSIQIIDPPIVVTRDTATVKVRSGVGTRPIVGRVTAAAGVYSLTANDVQQEFDAEGIFKTSVDLGAGKTRVTVVAVDRQGKRAALEFFLEPDSAVAKPIAVAPPRLSSQNLGLGKYYALVIGNQKYENPKIPGLNTPVADATEIAELLKDRYGFEVTLLLNATRWKIMEELNALRRKVTEKDNLLVYYAGHGQIDRANALANWLPVDADPASTANWIANSTLTETWNSMSAMHILVVADSCYSGAMTRSSIEQLQPGVSDEERLNQLKSIALKKSRTVLTSGGVSPVMDGGGGKHSIFAQAFINILRENQEFLLGWQLSDTLSARVLNVARKMNFDQRPEYGPIHLAGGESGDFIFSPSKM